MYPGSQAKKWGVLDLMQPTISSQLRLLPLIYLSSNHIILSRKYKSYINLLLKNSSKTSHDTMTESNVQYFIYNILFIWSSVSPISTSPFLGEGVLRWCAWVFSSCGKQGLLFVVVCGLFIAVASLVAKRHILVYKLSNTQSYPRWKCSTMWSSVGDALYGKVNFRSTQTKDLF